MGGIARLHTRPARLRLEAAQALKQTALAFEAEAPETISAVIGFVDRLTASEKGWTFVMLSPAQNRAVVGYLFANSERPRVAVQLWAELLMHLRMDTGEVLSSRAELAAAVEAPANAISTALSELEAFGAIVRRRRKIPGLRGPGALQIHVNPHVATKLGGAARDQAQAGWEPVLTGPNNNRERNKRATLREVKE